MSFEPTQPARAYLVDVDDGARLEFQINPAEFADDKGTVFARLRIPGASHPRLQFVGGEQRTLTFTITFYRIEDVQARVAWLQSLQYPEYQGGVLSNGPHRVMLLFGSIWEGAVWTVPTVKVKYGHPYKPDLTPLRADVEITLEQYVDKSLSVGDVRR